MEKNWLDIQHRGYSAYLEETKVSAARPKPLVCMDKADEQVDTVLCDCEVKTDWIEQIEAALPFVENAVYENRQFILRQGETVPIEKAKRVSKTSVEHLSRHSELITTAPKNDEDLIPDKIYMTENIGTYAVYENRFLYMLLCYLRDFVGFRYKRITELAASFSSQISINKESNSGSRQVRYCLHYSEVSQGEELACNSKTREAIERIRNILQTVELLLRTDLMREVAQAPMLKPPITRTNVLIHNPNFKIAFELYSFLTTYLEAGYEKIERYRLSGDFSHEMSADFTELLTLTSYLSYRSGGLYEELEKRFLLEETHRKEAAEKARKEKLLALKEKLGNIDGAAFDYILALEQRIAQLETMSDRLLAAQALQEETQHKLEASMAQMEQIHSEIDALNAGLEEKNEEINRLSWSSKQALTEAELRLQQANAQKEESEQRLNAQLEQQRQDFSLAYETLAEKYRLSNARVHALLHKQGLQISDAQFAAKDSFAELEAEYEAFKRFFAQQWKIAKKEIRKEQLWKRKNEK